MAACLWEMQPGKGYIYPPKKLQWTPRKLFALESRWFSIFFGESVQVPGSKRFSMVVQVASTRVKCVGFLIHIYFENNKGMNDAHAFTAMVFRLFRVVLFWWGAPNLLADILLSPWMSSVCRPRRVGFISTSFPCTRQGTNISHLENRKIMIFELLPRDLLITQMEVT